MGERFSHMLKAKIADVSWERIIGAVEKVRARLLRAAAALEKGGDPLRRNRWQRGGGMGLPHR